MRAASSRTSGASASGATSASATATSGGLRARYVRSRVPDASPRVVNSAAIANATTKKTGALTSASYVIAAPSSSWPSSVATTGAPK